MGKMMGANVTGVVTGASLGVTPCDVTMVTLSGWLFRPSTGIWCDIVSFLSSFTEIF